MKQKKVSLQTKMFLGIGLMAVLLLTILTPLVRYVCRQQMESYFSELAENQAIIGTRLISGDMAMDYYETGVMDANYQEILESLCHIKDLAGIKSFYVFIPKADEMIYLWDAATGEYGGESYQLGEHADYYDSEEREAMQSILHGDSVISVITKDNHYGYIASAYAPICNSAGEPVALSGVDISLDVITSTVRRFTALIFVAVVLAQLVSDAIYYTYVRKKLILPLNKLHQATSELALNDLEGLEQFTVDLTTGDEVEDVAEALQNMAQKLSVSVKDLARATAEKERIGAELDVANHIQSSMLPCIFPPFPGRPEFELYASMEPAKEVGGDFYDFFLIDRDHLGLVIADVSGKGVPAALFMVIAKTLLKNALQAGLSPKQTLERVNRQLCENNDAEMFVTVWCAVYHISTGELTAANAGHEYPAVCHADGAFQLYKDPHGFVLAGMEDSRYREYTLNLTPGDRLFVYTDGVPEATDGDSQLFGTERMLSALNSAAPENGAELLSAVHAEIDRFVGDVPQFDDITMLSMTVKKLDSASADQLQKTEGDECL